MSPATTPNETDDTGALPGVFRLHNHVQHYAWGDTQFIPALLGIENPGAKPYAELWMGAHPDLPSEVDVHGTRVSLDALIAESPDEILGAEVARRFDRRLPYLFKVLSAAVPLSIQVHPSKSSAEDGFDREDGAGTPISAPNRNYRDRNHKPELIVALTELYALRGFRPLSEIADVLMETPELADKAGEFKPLPESLKTLYEALMNLPQGEVNSVLGALVQRVEENDARQPYSASDREFWLMRCDRQFSRDGHRDRGLFSILLLNLIRLEPGEALALPAGVLHAYLQGSGMEIMANSNNVIRGGLTRKHVDVPELLRNVAFTGEAPRCLLPTRVSETVWLYETPFREFELRRFDVSESQSHETHEQHSAEILFVASTEESGSVTITTAAQESLELQAGSAALVRQGTAYRIDATGKATLFRAGVPADSDREN